MPKKSSKKTLKLKTKKFDVDEVIAIIDKIVSILGQGFSFGYFDINDIRQEARIFGLEAMARYDNKRPLENFLYSHIKNRLINFKRDKFHRSDPPCKICHEEGDHGNGEYCDKYKAWKKRNSSKQNLMRPCDITSVSDKSIERDSDIINDVATQEMLELIDEKLPVELRQVYLQLRSGVSISKAKKKQLEIYIKDILSEWRTNGEEDDSNE